MLKAFTMFLLLMQEEELDLVVLRKLGIKDNTKVELSLWKDFFNAAKKPKKKFIGHR